MATLQQAIDQARADLNDTDATNYRVSSADMLEYANDSLDAIADARPELFYEVDEVDCIDGETIQSFSPLDSLGMVRVIRVKGGLPVFETTEEILNEKDPTWTMSAPATATNWTRLADDPYRFLIYPPALPGQILVCLLVGVPKEYEAQATHRLPDNFTQIIVDYILHRCYGRDTKEQALPLAAAFLQSFYQKLGVSGQSSSATKPSEPKRPDE